MLSEFLEKTKGWKTYAVQIVAIVIGIAGYLWGPIDVGTISIPRVEFNELLEILQVGGGLSFLRMAVKAEKTKGVK